MPPNADDSPMAGFDSTPTIAVPDAVKVRATELADSLNQAMIQGHIEANIVTQLLDLVKEFLPLLTKGS